MAKFTVYQSSDVGAPVLTGLTGSLLNLLNQCLYSGYGSKTAAGWLKPLPDTSSYGMFQQPSGSKLSLFVMDTSSFANVANEALATGWESITDISNGKATGSNQFPTVAQLAVGQGSVIIRKSTTIDSVVRNWILFADDRTFYFFDQAENVAIYCWGFFFGDIYSYVATGSDAYKCIIVGRNATGISTAYEGADRMSNANAATIGNFMARTFNESGTSITVGKHGDLNRHSVVTYLSGINVYPNSTDMGLYMTPFYVTETTGVIRGTLRGQYCISHPAASLSNGQQFSGSGDFVGKTFMIIRPAAGVATNLGSYCIETSNTLDTN